MLELLSPAQSSLVLTLIVIPAVAVFLSDRIGKIRAVVNLIFDKLSFADKYVKVIIEGRAMALVIKEEIDKMLADGQFSEDEVKRLGEMAVSLYGKLSKED